MRMLVALSLLALTPIAARAETADDILKKADAAYSSFKDMTLSSKMLIYEPGSNTPREFLFNTWLKGNQKRLVRFTSPGDVKGMAMLLEDRDTMYVFLPAFNRVRRMGTHAKNQSFMGSDFGYEDMAETTFTGVYSPKLASETADAYVLDLTLNKGKEAEFPRIKLWIEKKHFLGTKMEFYDAGGKLARTELRDDFRHDEGGAEHWSPYSVTIIDHRRNDHKSTILLTSVKTDQGLSDDLFSQRALVRGN